MILWLYLKFLIGRLDVSLFKFLFFLSLLTEIHYFFVIFGSYGNSYIVEFSANEETGLKN